MSNPNKSLGTGHETAVKKWLQANGWPFAARRTQAGANDEGDLQLSEAIPFTIEAKTSRSTTDKAALGQYMKELQAEVANKGDEGGAVIFKKRGTTDVGEFYVLMPVKWLNPLLKAKYGRKLRRR